MIVRQLSKDGNLRPEVFTYLSNASHVDDYHQAHVLRLPLGIYNLSFHSITQGFQSVLRDAESLIQNAQTESAKRQQAGEALIKSIENLLYSLLSHIDDCYLILKATTPPQQLRRPPVFTDKWLEAAGHPGISGFKNEISSYRELLAPIVNKLKHGNGAIRCIYFKTDQYVLPGYYLESGTGSGVGPDPEFHPGNTALSLTKNLVLHLWGLYIIGKALKKALLIANTRYHNVGYQGGLATSNDTDELVAIINGVLRLPRYVFPDELDKKKPFLSLTLQSGEATLNLDFPGDMGFERISNGMFSSATKGDGVTRSFAFPYFDQRNQGTT